MMMEADRAPHLEVPAPDGELSTAPTSPASSFDDPIVYSAEVLKGSAKFNDFTTIDWIQDSLDERKRRLREAQESRGKVNASLEWAYRLYQAGQTWLVVALVGTSLLSVRVATRADGRDAGAAIGINAAIISIITEWASDLKMGYCRQGWWLNQKFCCWEIEAGNHGLGPLGGASGVLGAGGTEEGCEDWATWTRFTGVQYIVYVVMSIAFAYAAARIVRSFAPYAAGSGISEIKCILSGFDLPGYLSLPTLSIKSIALPLAIASGLSVGKEGPSVHVASCLGNVVAQNFQRFSRSQAKMREVVTAASAAGVAVAFGSPVGGVLFAFEEMTVTFPIKTMWRSFFCALVATVTLSAMNPFRTGKLVLFQVSYDRDWHFFEIGFFIVIGIFGGLYGAFVTKYNLQVAAFRRRHLASVGIQEAVVLAALTALVGYFNKFLRIDMTESLDILFRECEGGGDYDGLCQSWAQWRMVNSLLLATVLRTFLVILSYGCKVPAGIFVPSMAVGATFGRMVGILVKALYRSHPHWAMFSACDPEKPCITPGTYALLGAAAALGGIMRITVTVVVIMFELTGALTYILPTMIVLMVTKAVSDQLATGHGGIADQMIRFNGLPCFEKEDQAYGASIGSVMARISGGVAVIAGARGLESAAESRSVYALPARIPLNVLERECFGSRDGKKRFSGWPIVKSKSDLRILGYVGAGALQAAIARARREGIVAPDATAVLVREAATDVEEADEDDEDEVSAGEIDLSDAVNPTPLSVNPKQPVEIVMGLFKRLGPKVILIESRGCLLGLVSAKDLLRFSLLHEHTTHGAASAGSELDELLEEAGILLRETWAGVVQWVRGNQRDTRGLELR